MDTLTVVVIFGFVVVFYYLHFISGQLAKQIGLLVDINDTLYRQAHPSHDD